MMLSKVVALVLFIAALRCSAAQQSLEADPDRVFVTELKWERAAGAAQKVRSARGTLAIFYLEGVYAEVTSSFLRGDAKSPVTLNLNEGFVARIGTWSRTDDDQLIRIEARETVQGRNVPASKVAQAAQETSAPAPLKNQTCRLEGVSTTHIADTIVCTGGLVLLYPKRPIRLGDFPEIVRKIAQQKAADSAP